MGGESIKPIRKRIHVYFLMTAYHLKRAVSGSGILLSNDDGVSIHFKGGEGVLELVKDQPINITEFKK